MNFSVPMSTSLININYFTLLIKTIFQKKKFRKIFLPKMTRKSDLNWNCKIFECAWFNVCSRMRINGINEITLFCKNIFIQTDIVDCKEEKINVLNLRV